MMHCAVLFEHQQDFRKYLVMTLLWSKQIITLRDDHYINKRGNFMRTMSSLKSSRIEKGLSTKVVVSRSGLIFYQV